MVENVLIFVIHSFLENTGFIRLVGRGSATYPAPVSRLPNRRLFAEAGRIVLCSMSRPTSESVLPNQVVAISKRAAQTAAQGCAPAKDPMTTSKQKRGHF
jgi:hypothetical protein